MKNPTGIFVTGANGRMGRAVIRLVLNDNEVALVGTSEHPGSPAVGQDAGINAGTLKAGVSVAPSLQEALKGRAGVIIDFSSIEASMNHIQIALAHKTPIIIGTTGFNDAQVKKIYDAGSEIPVVFAPNMSIGMNLMFKLVGQAARVLKDGYDIEVFEAHHKHKKDAPSGTAVRLAKILCENTDRKYPDAMNLHREGIIGERTANEIGMQVLRGGDIVGEHTVFYCGEGERVEIKHTATSRDTFASGAIRAAKWLMQNKVPGVYGMWDVLGL